MSPGLSMELRVEQLCRVCDQPEGTDQPILDEPVERCPGCRRTVIDQGDTEYRRRAAAARRRERAIVEILEEDEDAHVR